MILKRLMCVSALALVTGNVLGCDLTSEGRVSQAGLCPTFAHIQAYLRVKGNLTPEDSETFRSLAIKEPHVLQENVKRIWQKFFDLYNAEKAVLPAVDTTESKPLSTANDLINIMSDFSRNEQRLYTDGCFVVYHALAGQVYYLQRFYWPEFFRQLNAYAGDYVFRAGVLHTVNPNTLRPFESIDDLMKYYKSVPDSRVMDAGIYCNTLLSGGRETSLSAISSAYMFDTFGSISKKGILQLLAPFFIEFGMNRDLAKRISQDVEKLYNLQCKECGNALVQIGGPYERANQLASFIWADGSKYDPRIAPLFKDFLSSPDSECELSFLHYMLECIDNRKGKLNGRVNDVKNASLTDRLLDLGRCVIKSQISKEAVRRRFLETVVEYKKLKPFSLKIGISA
ncbi:MAG: hypothetical protein K6C34_04105 [Alphaproteobacteria bacterium]|nr:hypothetical protein [Alphaproteobacteria bacterium]